MLNERVTKRLEKSIQWNKKLLNEWVQEAIFLAKERHIERVNHKSDTCHIEVLMNSPVCLRQCMEHVEYLCVQDMLDALHNGKTYRFDPKKYKEQVISLYASREWWEDYE